MKCSFKSAFLPAVLLSLAVGAVVGWLGWRTVKGWSSGPQVTATLALQSPARLTPEESKALAAQLLQEVLDGSRDIERDRLLKVRFQAALAGCDEAAIAEMLEVQMRTPMDTVVLRIASEAPTSEFCQLMVMRMAAMNSWRAFDYQVALSKAKAGVLLGAANFAEVMKLFSENELVQVQNVIEGLPPGHLRNSVDMACLRVRAKLDSEGVYQYLMSLDDVGMAKVSQPDYYLMGEVLLALADKDPKKALLVAMRLKGNSCYVVRRGLMARWSRHSRPAATQFAMEQNNAELFNECIYSADSGDSGLDEKYLRDNFDSINPKNTNIRVQLAQNLVKHLAKQDIHESVRWAGTLSGAEQEAANLVVAREWFKNDAAATAEWLATWPSGHFKDDVEVELVDTLEKVDPEAAFTWARGMQNIHRFELMHEAISSLSTKDPAAAARALNTLSEADRRALSAMIRNNLEIN